MGYGLWAMGYGLGACTQTSYTGRGGRARMLVVRGGWWVMDKT